MRPHVKFAGNLPEPGMLNHGMPLIETRGFTFAQTSLRPESRPGGSQTREAPAPGSRDC